MTFAGINYIAMLVAALVAWFFGGLWYRLLAKPWMAAHGFTSEQVRAHHGSRAAMWPLIVSFAAAFGVGVLVSDLVFGFAGIETTLPLIAFVFLVALGVDYNIFLVARAREEAERHGTADGMHRALASTGGLAPRSTLSDSAWSSIGPLPAP